MVVVVTVVEESLLCSFCVVFCRCRYCKSEECLQRLIDKASSALPTKSEETGRHLLPSATYIHIQKWSHLYMTPGLIIAKTSVRLAANTSSRRSAAVLTPV